MKYIIVAFATLLCSCSNIGTFGVWKNKHISKSDASSVKPLVDNVFHALQKKDVEYVKSISSSFIANQDMDALIDMCTNFMIDPMASNYEVIDEFLIKNTTKNGVVDINDTDFYANEYQYSCQILGEKTYVCLMAVEALAKGSKWLVTCKFNKENNQWKLTGLLAAPYSFKNMAAPQLLLHAKELYAQNKKIEAFMYTEIAMISANPSGVNLHFKRENEISSFLTQLNSEGKSLVFPPKNMDIQLVSIIQQLGQDKAYPLICYKTKTLLSDTKKLEQENDLLNQQIDKIIPGICEFSDTILYSAKNDDVVNGKLGTHTSFLKQCPSVH